MKVRHSPQSDAHSLEILRSASSTVSAVVPPATPPPSAALSSPKLTLRSSPFPGLRCPVNVRPIFLFYTDGHVFHRNHETQIRPPITRRRVVNR